MTEDLGQGDGFYWAKTPSPRSVEGALEVPRVTEVPAISTPASWSSMHAGPESIATISGQADLLRPTMTSHDVVSPIVEQMMSPSLPEPTAFQGSHFVHRTDVSTTEVRQVVHVSDGRNSPEDEQPIVLPRKTSVTTLNDAIHSRTTSMGDSFETTEDSLSYEKSIVEVIHERVISLESIPEESVAHTNALNVDGMVPDEPSLLGSPRTPLMQHQLKRKASGSSDLIMLDTQSGHQSRDEEHDFFRSTPNTDTLWLLVYKECSKTVKRCRDPRHPRPSSSVCRPRCLCRTTRR